MISYVIVIFIFSFFIFLADKAKDKGNHVLYYMLTLIALLGISFFAGMRHLNVGIDITTYGKNIFESTVLYGPKEAQITYARWADVGYIYYNYLVSLITQNLNVYLGILQFCILLSFVSFFRKFRKSINPSLAVLLLNFSIFALSFSMLRQALAMSISVWIYYYLVKRKYTSVVVISITSVLVHKSAILFLVVILILFFYAKIKGKIKEKKLIWIVLVLTLLLSIILSRFPQTLDIILGELRISNIQQQNFGSPARFLLFFVPIIYFRIANKNRFMESNEDYFLYLFCLVVISFSWLSGINYSIARFTNYLYPFYMLFIAKQCRINGSSKVYVGIIIWACVVFWWLIVRGNEGGVIPYVPYWQEYNPLNVFY